jgi:hypothetical protein
MGLLDQLSEEVIHGCLEQLEELWLSQAQPGDDFDDDALEPCPNCGVEQCQIVTILQAIRDDVCTGRFDLHCTLCEFSGVVYGRVYASDSIPTGQTRGEVSLSPYSLP